MILHFIFNNVYIFFFQDHTSIVVELGDAETDLESLSSLYGDFNIGLLMLRPSTATFVKSWNLRIWEEESEWDQRIFNNMVKVDLGYDHPEARKGIFW